MSDGVNTYIVTIGLPVTIQIEADGYTRLSVDVADIAELTRDVSEGSASVQVLAYGQHVVRDADEYEVGWVAEYLDTNLASAWLECDDMPGWDMIEEGE